MHDDADRADMCVNGGKETTVKETVSDGTCQTPIKERRGDTAVVTRRAQMHRLRLPWQIEMKDGARESIVVVEQRIDRTLLQAKRLDNVSAAMLRCGGCW